MSHVNQVFNMFTSFDNNAGMEANRQIFSDIQNHPYYKHVMELPEKNVFQFNNETYLQTSWHCHGKEVCKDIHHPSIKLKAVISDIQIQFLDTTIFIKKQSDTFKLLSKVYFKETDTHQPLDKQLFQPKHTFSGTI